MHCKLINKVYSAYKSNSTELPHKSPRDSEIVYMALSAPFLKTSSTYTNKWTRAIFTCLVQMYSVLHNHFNRILLFVSQLWYHCFSKHLHWLDRLLCIDVYMRYLHKMCSVCVGVINFKTVYVPFYIFFCMCRCY